MKDLPLGIHDFETLRSNNFLYVDKTRLLYALVRKPGRFFLSRPRRFGKSLTISTLEAIFQGKKELFKGLWIENEIGWQSYPVLRFSFDAITTEERDIADMLGEELQLRAAAFGLTLRATGVKARTQELIRALGRNKKVVVLVDEYDKPILDALPERQELAERRRTVIKEFFESLKSEDGLIQCIFVTGVSKFAKMTLFSGPNQLSDISLWPEFSSLCGYSEEELNLHFAPFFPFIANENHFSIEQTAYEIRDWYNGYAWSGEKVYNPWSILNAARSGRISNYWFASGSPSFLLRYLKSGLHYRLGPSTVHISVLDSFDLDQADYRALLFQGGYLTIVSENKQDNSCVLDYPNREVEESLQQHMLTDYGEMPLGDSAANIYHLRDAFRSGDMKQIENVINALFAGIPSQIFLARYEAYYHSILHLTFTLLGYYIQSEVSTSVGRADAVIFAGDKIYILEFKVNGTAQKALSQIKKQAYYEKYKTTGKTIVLVGIGLSAKKKGVSSLVFESLQTN